MNWSITSTLEVFTSNTEPKLIMKAGIGEKSDIEFDFEQWNQWFRVNILKLVDETGARLTSDEHGALMDGLRVLALETKALYHRLVS